MKNFTENIYALWGDAGKDWLKLLPRLVDQISLQWGLRDLSVVKNLSYNYVLTGFQEDSPVVLKFIFDKRAFEQERDALMFYKSNGCVGLLDSDQETQCLLLECIKPGISLRTFCLPENFKSTGTIEEYRVRSVVELMKKLHTVTSIEKDLARFQSINFWLKDLFEIQTDRIPEISEKYLIKARSLSQELMVSQAKPVLLHGDLHHENILLRNRDSWVAIDPKGVIGEKEYEVGAFIRNPMPSFLEQQNPEKTITRTIELFADYLEMDKQRLQAWSFVQAVLAACWMVQDNQDPKNMLVMTSLLDNFI